MSELDSTKQNNENTQGLMRIANGQAGPGVVAKQTIDPN